MIRKIKQLTYVLVGLLITSACYADLASDMGNMFNSLGFQTNTSPSTTYKNQQAGYYSGGSVFARSQVRNINLLQLQGPRVQFGCNGIDVYLGSYSFIDKNALVSSLKAIGSNAIGYAFSIALATLCPQCKATLDKLQTWINKINSFNRNSCEMARMIVDSVADRRNATQHESCVNQSMEYNECYDRNDCKEMCSSLGRQTEMNDKRTMLSGKTNDDLWHEYNLTVRLLGKISPYNTDPELIKAAMSIVGTIMTRKKNPGCGGTDDCVFESVTYIGSDDVKTIFNALYRGGLFDRYDCPTLTGSTDVDTVNIACADMVKDPGFQVTKAQSYSDKVIVYLDNIVSAINNRTVLGQPEINFLDNISLPVYKLLSVAAAYNSGKKLYFYVKKYQDAIGLLYTYDFMTNVIRDLRQALQLQEKLEADKKATYMWLLDHAEIKVQAQYKLIHKKLGNVHQMIKEIRQVERLLVSNLPERLSNRYGS